MSSFAQKLDKFGADLAKKSVMGKEIRVPYTDLTSYFGYIKPGSTPDEVKKGKKNVLYLRLDTSCRTRNWSKNDFSCT